MIDESTRWLRWLVLSLGGAALAAAVYVAMIWLDAQHNSNDGAYGQPLLLVLLDPFVVTVAAPVALFAGLAAFVLAYCWLDTTVMWKTAALMYSAVLLELIIAGPQDIVRTLSLACVTLLGAAIVSKLLFTRTPMPGKPGNPTLRPTAGTRGGSAASHGPD